MLELVSSLMSILMIEGFVLLVLNVISLILIIKEIFDSKESIKNFKKVATNFKNKVNSNEKYSNICKAVVVLYGMTKLTALWCFSILFGVVFTKNIWIIMSMLVVEILLIALHVRNKFVVNSEDVINTRWIVSKVEILIQKKFPKFSVKSSCEKAKYVYQGYFNKEKSAN